MKIVIFGLSITSSWGNGHATLWRGLFSALGRRGHHVVFFERDVPYYAAHRDFRELRPGEVILYGNWAETVPRVRRHLKDADVAIVTSYCPDSIAATAILSECSHALNIFYDLDSPVTLERIRAGRPLDYIGPRKLRDFDLVLSYAGGPALEEMKTRLLAQRVAPLYGSADPSIYRPTPPQALLRSDLSYLGTNSPDREASLNCLFFEAAAKAPDKKFLLGGAKYETGTPWHPNVFFRGHVPSSEHSVFFCSSRLTLNVTRQAMRETGFSPSGRLFEATACGAPVLTDTWPGIEQFFEPGVEILTADTTSEVLAALDRSPEELARIGEAGRSRTLRHHTAEARARQLENIFEEARHSVSYAAEAS